MTGTPTWGPPRSLSHTQYQVQGTGNQVPHSLSLYSPRRLAASVNASPTRLEWIASLLAFSRRQPLLRFPTGVRALARSSGTRNLPSRRDIAIFANPVYYQGGVIEEFSCSFPLDPRPAPSLLQTLLRAAISPPRRVLGKVAPLLAWFPSEIWHLLCVFCSGLRAPRRSLQMSVPVKQNGNILVV